MSGEGIGIFKRDIDPTAIILTPSSVLFLRESRASSGGLSAGAIAGIVVGSVVAAAAGSVAIWSALRRQRVRQYMADGASYCKAPSLAPGVGGSSSISGSSSAPQQPAHAGAMKAARVSNAPFSAAAEVVHGRPQQPVWGPSAKALQSVRPVPASLMASPFAALSEVQLSATSAGPLTAMPSRKPSDLPPVPELMAMVEAEEEGAMQRSSNRKSGSSGTSEPPELMLASTLPAGLREWVISPSAIQYLRWSNGQRHELGAGAR